VIQEESTIHQEKAPCFDLCRYISTDLNPKLNRYVDNDAKKCGLLAVLRTEPVSHDAYAAQVRP